jgi:hypothetical protein
MREFWGRERGREWGRRREKMFKGVFIDSRVEKVE